MNQYDHAWHLSGSIMNATPLLGRPSRYDVYVMAFRSMEAVHKAAIQQGHARAAELALKLDQSQKRVRELEDWISNRTTAEIEGLPRGADEK